LQCGTREVGVNKVGTLRISTQQGCANEVGPGQVSATDERKITNFEFFMAFTS
jgi:hypothetical protein